MGCLHSLPKSNAKDQEIANPLSGKQKKVPPGDHRGGKVPQVQVLLAFMSATNFENWTNNKEGWKELADGMSDEQVARCKPAGVTFDGNWKITGIDLEDVGLTGIRPRMMALQYRQ